MVTSADLWLPPTARTAEFRKSPPPKLGEKFGQWAGEDVRHMTLPGGGILQFDLSKLTLADYRSMREHYQVNANLLVMTFMMQRLDWKIECKDKKIATFIEETMREVWNRLIRGISQAFWAGYSPLAIQWENDLQNNKIVATKFKDLLPEHCRVKWKTVEGYAPEGRAKPKFFTYDGIKQGPNAGGWFAGGNLGTFTQEIPVENTLWYPLLMENGDYYGKKLLKPAFPSWFFSILIHLFVNRYFERFGEPLPVGRANYDSDVELGGNTINGREAMESILTALRNRSVVVLPSDRDPETNEYDFAIEYIESQMRGADFERYLTRLDEEISIGLFTPILLLRTADVGSYNLGIGHMQLFMWMLNALAGDMKEYIDKYYIRRLKDYNFGPNAPAAYWVPRQMGKENAETMRAVVSEILRKGKAKPDLDELGEIIGLSLQEVREVTEPEPEPDVPPPGDGEDDAPPPDDRTGRDRPPQPAPRKEVTAQLNPATEAFRPFIAGWFAQGKPEVRFPGMDSTLMAWANEAGQHALTVDDFMHMLDRVLWPRTREWDRDPA